MKTARIDVIVIEATEDEMSNNALFQLIKNHERGSVSIAPIDRADEFHHFILVGESRYRVELDDGKKDAVASFNNPIGGRFLASFYDTWTEYCRLIG